MAHCFMGQRYGFERQGATKNSYLYNGKELQDELNLGWLDYGARIYMSDVGRWGVVDPLGEKVYGQSPFSYCFNNPLYFTDPTGALPTYDWNTSEYKNEDGEVISWEEAYQDIKKNTGGPKGKRNVMVIMNNNKQLNAMQAAESVNENWYWIFADNLDKATSKVSEYFQTVGPINNLVIRCHGSANSIGLALSEGYAGDDAEMLNSTDLYDAGGNTFQNEGDRKSAEAIKIFANSLAGGGNLIFTACQAGQEGGKLGEFMWQYLKEIKANTNLNIYLNGDLSIGQYEVSNKETGNTLWYQILDMPLSSASDHMYGWFKIGTDGKAQPMAGSIQLNSTGKPIIFSIAPYIQKK